MAPPHLHPRSRMTSSLFATTVFASFFVVVLPHILPCPAPRVALADGQMAVAADGTVTRRRRRRRPQDEVMAPAAPAAEVERGEDGMARFAMVNTDDDGASQSAKSTSTSTSASGPRRAARECPVPKPSGIVGELLGFKSGSSPQQQQQQQQQLQQQRLPQQPPLEK